MIIDVILDRKDGEQTGEKYDPRAFYRAILRWIDLNPKPAGEITAALDYATLQRFRFYTLAAAEFSAVTNRDKGGKQHGSKIFYNARRLAAVAGLV